ncbi:MAG: ubiquinone biosynthesis hydroxylase [Rhizobiaceae bacterium]|nr:ubiquinone biosynthesis hydroxylase [Rhizobiaceae bacterium]PCI02311.1 MAG: 2-octaprenyl-6-methoxyphenyl hydroxylase [Hyphomicrobiales bacterium]
MAKPENNLKTCDILIVGGNYVGLSTAVAICAGGPHLSVVVVEAAPVVANEKDQRAFAVAAAASRMLDQLGIWQDLLEEAQPINEMVITDSKLSDVTRPVFLTFANERKTEDGDDPAPFAHMLPNRVLVEKLREKALDMKIKLINGDSVLGFKKGPASVDIKLASGISYRAKLLVAADGVRSKMRDQAGIKTVHWPYDQKGIVTTIAHERPHEGRAEEHFLPAGPFAVLPLKGNRSSLVWTESSQSADRLLAMDDLSFELELEQRFGHKLGEISIDGPVKAFPLGLTLAREFVKDRIALVGDAAHGIHPISGQGLNLGFKDAAALAETIVEADRLGMDIGALTTLERYQQWRRFDTVQMGIVTDVLNRLFSNDNPLLRAARDFGLGMVERMPGLKTRFIDQASGNSKSEPRLLQGEAI